MHLCEDLRIRHRHVGFSVGRRISGVAGCFPEPDDVRQWIYRVAGTNKSDHP